MLSLILNTTANAAALTACSSQSPTCASGSKCFLDVRPGKTVTAAGLFELTASNTNGIDVDGVCIPNANIKEDQGTDCDHDATTATGKFCSPKFKCVLGTGACEAGVSVTTTAATKAFFPWDTCAGDSFFGNLDSPNDVTIYMMEDADIDSLTSTKYPDGSMLVHEGDHAKVNMYYAAPIFNLGYTVAEMTSKSTEGDVQCLKTSTGAVTGANCKQATSGICKETTDFCYQHDDIKVDGVIVDGECISFPTGTTAAPVTTEAAAGSGANMMAVIGAFFGIAALF